MNPNNKELIYDLIKISFKQKVENKGYNDFNYRYNDTNETEEKYNIYILLKNL